MSGRTKWVLATGVVGAALVALAPRSDPSPPPPDAPEAARDPGPHLRVLGTVWKATPLDEATPDTPLSGARVVHVLSGEWETTDEQGRLTLPGGNVATALFGPACVIFNDAGEELLNDGLEFSRLNYRTTGELDRAQVSAFYWTNRIFGYTRDIMGNRLEYLPTRVNADGPGVAYWDGFALVLPRSGNGFPNLAYADIVVHEYGHAVDARLGGILNWAYSEGFGDALAILITEQPVIPRKLPEGTRDASIAVSWNLYKDWSEDRRNEYRWEVGQVYSGFVWRLIEELKFSGVAEPMAVAKRLVLGAAEKNPKDIPDAVRLGFIADDNDGNLGNGTPHFKQLAAAADSRGLPRPRRRDEK